MSLQTQVLTTGVILCGTATRALFFFEGAQGVGRSVDGLVGSNREFAYRYAGLSGVLLTYECARNQPTPVEDALTRFHDSRKLTFTQIR
jgi:hypothetical protein